MTGLDNHLDTRKSCRNGYDEAPWQSLKLHEDSPCAESDSMLSSLFDAPISFASY